MVVKIDWKLRWGVIVVRLALTEVGRGGRSYIVVCPPPTWGGVLFQYRRIKREGGAIFE